MVDFYVMQIRMGLMTLAEVPAEWREQVRRALYG